jgi:hypothetical protein
MMQLYHWYRSDRWWRWWARQVLVTYLDSFFLANTKLTNAITGKTSLLNTITDTPHLAKAVGTPNGHRQ